MPDQLPKKFRTPAQEAFETLAFCWGGVAIAVFCWQYDLPIVHPLVQQVNSALSQFTLPWLQKTFGHVNPVLGLLLNLSIVTTVLFVFSMALIPVLERLFLRDLIRRADREGRKIEAVREGVQVSLEKKNHAR
ncbi:MAG TPA: hypothetical protein VK673_13730 [Chthoniobacterales bacterium]|nr:hypothetical protein [Chthoniobacterales bacterium]